MTHNPTGSAPQPATPQQSAVMQLTEAVSAPLPTFLPSSRQSSSAPKIKEGMDVDTVQQETNSVTQSLRAKFGQNRANTADMEAALRSHFDKSHVDSNFPFPESLGEDSDDDTIEITEFDFGSSTNAGGDNNEGPIADRLPDRKARPNRFPSSLPHDTANIGAGMGDESWLETPELSGKQSRGATAYTMLSAHHDNSEKSRNLVRGEFAKRQIEDDLEEEGKAPEETKKGQSLKRKRGEVPSFETKATLKSKKRKAPKERKPAFWADRASHIKLDEWKDPAQTKVRTPISDELVAMLCGLDNEQREAFLFFSPYELPPGAFSDLSSSTTSTTSTNSSTTTTSSSSASSSSASSSSASSSSASSSSGHDKFPSDPQGPHLAAQIGEEFGYKSFLTLHRIEFLDTSDEEALDEEELKLSQEELDKLLSSVRDKWDAVQKLHNAMVIAPAAFNELIKRMIKLTPPNELSIGKNFDKMLENYISGYTELYNQSETLLAGQQHAAATLGKTDKPKLMQLRQIDSEIKRALRMIKQMQNMHPLASYTWCSKFIYTNKEIGGKGESNAWLDGVLENAPEKLDQQFLNDVTEELLGLLDVPEEYMKPGISDYCYSYVQSSIFVMLSSLEAKYPDDFELLVEQIADMVFETLKKRAAVGAAPAEQEREEKDQEGSGDMDVDDEE